MGRPVVLVCYEWFCFGCTSHIIGSGNWADVWYNASDTYENGCAEYKGCYCCTVEGKLRMVRLPMLAVEVRAAVMEAARGEASCS